MFAGLRNKTATERNDTATEQSSAAFSAAAPAVAGTRSRASPAVRLHLRDGSINPEDSRVGQALHCAARAGNERYLRILFDHGAGIMVNWIDPDCSKGNSALHWAASRSHAAVVQLLCSNGAKIDLKNANENTALHEATLSGAREVVEVLLDLGGRIRGSSALKIVGVESKRRRVDGADVNFVDWKNARTLDSALHLASREGNAEIVALLLDSGGADIDSQNGAGSTPLHLASEVAHTDVMKILLDRGCKVDVKKLGLPNRSSIPLHLASRAGHVEAVKLLLGGGGIVTIDMQTYGDRLRPGRNTAIHLASAAGRVGVVKVLLQNGARIDLPNSEGNTALHLACRSHAILLRSGSCNSSSSSCNAASAAHDEEETPAVPDHPAVVELLLKACAEFDLKRFHDLETRDHPSTSKAGEFQSVVDLQNTGRRGGHVAQELAAGEVLEKFQAVERAKEIQRSWNYDNAASIRSHSAGKEASVAPSIWQEVFTNAAFWHKTADIDGRKQIKHPLQEDAQEVGQGRREEEGEEIVKLT